MESSYGTVAFSCFYGQLEFVAFQTLYSPCVDGIDTLHAAVDYHAPWLPFMACEANVSWQRRRS